MKVIARRNFVDDDGKTYRTGDEVAGWSAEKIDEYLRRVSPGNVIRVEDGEPAVGEAQPVEEAKPKQTLGDALKGQTVEAVLRLVDAGHVKPAEALLIESSNRNRKTLVAALEERLGDGK